MRRLLTALLLACCPLGATAQGMPETILPLDAELREGGQALYLTWRDAQKIRVGPIDINRRPLGARGGETWAPLVQNMKPLISYTDETLRPGRAYEYQVIRKARDVVDVGYWIAGTELPARAARGTVLLVVEDSLPAALPQHLSRLGLDLVGDGWTVKRLTVPRHTGVPLEDLANAQRIRTWIATQVAEDRATPHAVLLLGHVPIVKSGSAAPDGHQSVPHATDLFYAEMNMQWRDDGEGRLEHNFVPDLTIELQVGRVDFAPVAGGGKDPAREARLLAAWMDKAHHWRHARHGDLRQAYGTNRNLAVEQAMLRPLVGPEQITQGGHHDVGEAQPWLFGVDFGHAKGGEYAGRYANKAVFAINFGSHKQKFDRPGNAMVALLAQPWYPVAVGWGGRPAWWLQHMALGGSIGEVHLRSVNNGLRAERDYRATLDYYPTGRYLFRNPVWVNLMGDPTLRAFPLAPARDVAAQAGVGGTVLSWAASPDPDVLGYHVFRRAPGGQVFEHLTPDAPLTGTQFTDPAGAEGAIYMVRAYGLKTVYAGSFYTYAQGAFAQAGFERPARPALPTLETPQNVPLRLGFPPSGHLWGFVAGPEQGRLTQDAEGWLFTPDPAYLGEVTLRAAASDLLSTYEVPWTLRVTEAVVVEEPEGE